MSSVDYKQAGVDIDAGNRLVRRIGPHARSTARLGMLDALGGFGELTEVPSGCRQRGLVYTAAILSDASCAESGTQYAEETLEHRGAPRARVQGGRTASRDGQRRFCIALSTVGRIRASGSLDPEVGRG